MTRNNPSPGGIELDESREGLPFAGLSLDLDGLAFGKSVRLLWGDFGSVDLSFAVFACLLVDEHVPDCFDGNTDKPVRRLMERHDIVLDLAGLGIAIADRSAGVRIGVAVFLLAVRSNPGRSFEQAPDDFGGCYLASPVIDVLLVRVGPLLYVIHLECPGLPFAVRDGAEGELTGDSFAGSADEVRHLAVYELFRDLRIPLHGRP